MRGFRYPIGPEEPETYWGRRVLVLVAFLAVVGLFIWIVNLVFGGDKDQEASPATSQSSRGVPLPSMDPSAKTTGKAPGDPGAEPTPESTGPVPECDPATVKVSLRAETPAKINTDVVLDVALTNATPDACTIDLAKVPFELKISSGDDRIWSTLDCPTGAPAGVLTLKSVEPQTFQITWTTKRSAASCVLSDEDLPAGIYVAAASLEGSATVTQEIQLQ